MDSIMDELRVFSRLLSKRAWINERLDATLRHTRARNDFALLLAKLLISKKYKIT